MKPARDELAARSRGTPRIANRLLRRVRDFAQVHAEPVVTREIALGALELLEIDAAGFDKMDRAILSAIIDKFDGGPVGVESLAAAVGEESDTIEEVYEPYLLQEGFLARTSRGRVATQRAYTHLGPNSLEALCSERLSRWRKFTSCSITRSRISAPSPMRSKPVRSHGNTCASTTASPCRRL